MAATRDRCCSALPSSAASVVASFSWSTWDGLRGGSERQRLPAGNAGQRFVEARCRVDGLHDLDWCAPALGRALLEEAEAVAGAVRQVDES